MTTTFSLHGVGEAAGAFCDQGRVISACCDRSPAIDGRACREQDGSSSAKFKLPISYQAETTDVSS